MKTKEEYIKSIHVVDSNFEHIAKTGKINGTLMLGIDRILDEYAEEYAKAVIEWMIWCSTGVNPDTEVVNARMNEFKESLKK